MFPCMFMPRFQRLPLSRCESSLPDSYYDKDQSFQALKFKFIGNIQIADIAESITLYLKKVRGMEQRLQRLLAHHVP